MKMQEFVVEKGIPVTTIEQRRKKRKYPWSEMEIMDSFFVECKKEEMERFRNTISGSLTQWNVVNSKRYKIITRYITAEGGLRIWRIA